MVAYPHHDCPSTHLISCRETPVRSYHSVTVGEELEPDWTKCNHLTSWLTLCFDNISAQPKDKSLRGCLFSLSPSQWLPNLFVSTLAHYFYLLCEWFSLFLLIDKAVHEKLHALSKQLTPPPLYTRINLHLCHVWKWHIKNTETKKSELYLWDSDHQQQSQRVTLCSQTAKNSPLLVILTQDSHVFQVRFRRLE